MSRKPWWTELTADKILHLRRRVLRRLDKEFASSLGTETQDVVQQAFVALLRNRPEVHPEHDGLYRYLLVVARRVALDRLRQVRHRKTPRHRMPPGSTSPPSPAQQAVLREESEEIRKVFRELGELDRLIVWSHIVERRSIRAIAGDLDLGWHQVADTVKRVLHDIRRRMGD